MLEGEEELKEKERRQRYYDLPYVIYALNERIKSYEDNERRTSNELLGKKSELTNAKNHLEMCEHEVQRYEQVYADAKMALEAIMRTKNSLEHERLTLMAELEPYKADLYEDG